MIDFSVVADVICVPPQTSRLSHCIELCVVVSSHIGISLYSVDFLCDLLNKVWAVACCSTQMRRV